MLKRADFHKVYAPMAKEGKTALEIGQALGFEGTDDEIRGKVTVKSGQLRAEFRRIAKAEAERKGLGEQATAKLVEQANEAWPVLTKRSRKPKEAQDLSDALAELLEKADNPSE